MDCGLPAKQWVGGERQVAGTREKRLHTPAGIDDGACRSDLGGEDLLDPGAVLAWIARLFLERLHPPQEVRHAVGDQRGSPSSIFP